MRAGTPGFIGERLKEAREARGLNGIAFADLVGVTRQAISAYEKNVQTPSPQIMQVICDRLGLPIQFFLRPASFVDNDRVFYRSMSTATKAQRGRAERRFSWLKELVAYLRRFLVFPEVRFPVFDDIPADPVTLTDSQIELYAESTRRHWGLGDGPISNIAWLLENNGAIVSRQDLGADKLDAFSQWSSVDDTPYFVLGTEHASAVRSRFDAAHELGHMVLHRAVSEQVIGKPATFNLIEDQAHRFAAAFLLPAKSFAREFRCSSIDSLVPLKSRWRASIACMIMRASHLNLLSEQQQKRLWIARSRRGWNTLEPLDGQLQCEKPRFIGRCFELLSSQGIISPESLLTNLGLSVPDIEAVAGVDGLVGETIAQNQSDEFATPSPAIIRFPSVMN